MIANIAKALVNVATYIKMPDDISFKKVMISLLNHEALSPKSYLHQLVTNVENIDNMVILFDDTSNKPMDKMWNYVFTDITPYDSCSVITSFIYYTTKYLKTHTDDKCLIIRTLRNLVINAFWQVIKNDLPHVTIKSFKDARLFSHELYFIIKSTIDIIRRVDSHDTTRENYNSARIAELKYQKHLRKITKYFKINKY